MRSRPTPPLIMVLSVAGALAGVSAAASDASDIESHKKSVAAALSELGVGEFEALHCMMQMPDHVWLGSKLDKQQGAADKAALLSCLQEKNPDLTEAELDKAVDLFR